MVVLTELLPPGSCSSTHHNTNNQSYKYDVFLSFRGADTRKTFTGHLYNALLDARITTFFDDDEIETGQHLKPELESAIKTSRAAIIVLSKNYATSTWCLNELALILEQQEKFNQIVIPIFYHVEPTDVRYQKNTFGEAMAKHKWKMDTETDPDKKSQWGQKMELWKMALTQVANLKGEDAKDRNEPEFIEQVVANIHRRLGVPLISNTLPSLIGVECEIEFISSWLTDGSSCHTADILTVAGISGIGKTSLVRYVFGLHSSKFQKSCFIEGIDARCNERLNGLLKLQKQLHGGISKKMKIRVHDVNEYSSKIQDVLARKRVFIVLDDIGSINQLDALLGNKGLHPGSKVIVTTKDAFLTERCALFNPQVQPKHTKVSHNGLCNTDSLELLCVQAFKCRRPEQGYEEVAKTLVKYCHGHPLAIEVLGKFLHKQDLAYWQEFIEVLQKEHHPDIKKALKTSFDALLFQNDKELFKHIACFFVGVDRDLIETILVACGIKTKIGIKNLVDKGLLSIESDNKLVMHSLIQEIGRDLVFQESPMKPWKRSRLWCSEESFKVLKTKKGKECILGLALDTRMLDKKKSCDELKTKSFSQMDNLMLLQLNYVQLNGCFKKFPEELRWLCMHGSPLKSIPLDFPMDNLVALDMSYSHIESFDMSCSNPQPPAKRQKGLIASSSKDKRLLGSLKILDLSFCERLHIIGGFFELPALERLIVKNCISLIEVCESVEQCDELVHIDLTNCYKLRKLPNFMGKLKKVKTLLLDGCNSRDVQIEMGNVKAIPSDLKFIMISLPSSIRTLSLANNNLSNESFPPDFSCLSMLEALCLDFNPIVSMPDCVRTLPRLKELFMDDCEMLILIENPPCTLRVLTVEYTHLDNECVLKKLKFDHEMSPISIRGVLNNLSPSDYEIDGMVKIQSMASVEEEILHSLGWKNLDFIKERRIQIDDMLRTSYRTQMYYEFGIFSTFYEGKEMPDWISFRSKESPISFVIPSSSKKLRGLNLCCVEAYANMTPYEMSLIKICNATKKHTWIYRHCVKVVEFGVTEDGGENYICLLSHWMFGPNEMEAGDHITITLGHKGVAIHSPRGEECGIGLVYDDDDDGKIEEEDVLGYYKAWNHIIGGDLSHFQLITGEYLLDIDEFTRYSPETFSDNDPFLDFIAIFKEETVMFKAFSQKKKSNENVGNAIQLVDDGGRLALINASSIEPRTMLEAESEAGMMLEMDRTEVIPLLELPEVLKAKDAEATSVSQQQGRPDHPLASLLSLKESKVSFRAFQHPNPSSTT